MYKLQLQQEQERPIERQQPIIVVQDTSYGNVSTTGNKKALF
jgi:hypothetical protein